jgi:hypothetical protein
MSLAIVYTRALGIEARLLRRGSYQQRAARPDHGRLPETTVKEARDRVRSDDQQRLRFPAKKSPSTWRQPICQRRRAIRSTYRSRASRRLRAAQHDQTESI